MDVFPSSPGVYWFLAKNDEVLYVGKAKSLRKRLSQYAHAQDNRPQIYALARETKTARWDIAESELQALLVEAELIRRYQPHFNILLKDDKSDLYICLSKDEFPHLFTARKPEVVRATEKLQTFGPYPSAFKVKQVLTIARKIFKWCDHPNSKHPCFYYHLDLCDGACVGKYNPEQYQEKIADLKRFLHGKTSELIREMKLELESASQKKYFEVAAIKRDQLQALIQVTSPKYRLAPDMVLPTLTANMEQEALVSLRAILRQYLNIPASLPLTRIEGYDVSNIQGTNASCSMVVAMDGRMTNSEYKHFGIKTLNTPNDFGMLKEALLRRQNHPEWTIPDVILIDGGKGQLRTALTSWTWPSIIISIAKRPDRLLIPIISFGKLSKSSSKKMKVHNLAGFDPDDRKTMKIAYKEIVLTSDFPATRLIQSIRDESHRFAKRLHTIKRNTNFLK